MTHDHNSSSAAAAKKVSSSHLFFQVQAKLTPVFFQLLGQGFSVNIQSESTVKDLLCKQLGIHEEYLAQKIKTIFLNAKVVDDVDTAIVADDSTLALSGAMPGLVGAILRSGGYLAAMRTAISHLNHQTSCSARSAQIKLKLMNIVVKELGPIFLQQGIRIEGRVLREFVDRRMVELTAGCLNCEINGKSIDVKDLIEMDWDDDLILLQVCQEARDC